MLWGAVIVAAGRGTRFGRPKQLIELGGKPMLAWSIEAFASMPEISDISIVTEAEFIEDVQDVALPLVRSASVSVVAGGADRQASAANGIAALPEHCAGIFIHDGARPFVRPADVRAGMRAVRPGVAALLAVPVVDTIKVVDGGQKVTRTLDRIARIGRRKRRSSRPRATCARPMPKRCVTTGRAPPMMPACLKRSRQRRASSSSRRSENVNAARIRRILVRAQLIAQERNPVVVAEEDVFLVECFVEQRSVDAVLMELESRLARIDGVDRDLAQCAAVIRAYAGSGRAARFRAAACTRMAGDEALFTTHLSHVVARA